MIEIIIRDDGISVTGHSGYAPPGQDIVCAGISSLLLTLSASLAALISCSMEEQIKPGEAYINYRNLSEQGLLLVDSFSIGVAGIASEYPDNVHFTDLREGGIQS